MKKHINALLGFVCYTIGVIAAAYYGLWKMLVLPLHTLAVSFLAGDLNITLLAVCVVKILFSTTMAGLIWCIGYIAYNHFKGTQDPDWETMEKEYMAEKEEKEHGDEKERYGGSAGCYCCSAVFCFWAVCGASGRIRSNGMQKQTAFQWISTRRSCCRFTRETMRRRRSSKNIR